MTVVDAGKHSELTDATTSRLHLVDDLRDAHDLLPTIRRRHPSGIRIRSRLAGDEGRAKA